MVSAIPADLKTASIELAQATGEAGWVVVDAVERMPGQVVMPMHRADPGYETWWREVRCVLVISRRPEQRHIPWQEGVYRMPLYTQCVFWYRDVSLVLDAVEVFCLSFHGPPLTEILRRLEAKQKEEVR